ncbi:aquaporin family protein [Siculibacillus lacustris]|uniref:Aquaporin family protein n=1 Tax=Siculibacillus lacustris TaxID=1549641 RepID=A0A4V2KSC7_9HYPH|nr:MIP/aquaporin family protein [Siculibacillus lacustris]TBW32177.1 aquaporin family protein [Siculibacillus lacustris]
MHGQIFGEFLGTMALIILGDGVVANLNLKKTGGNGAGLIVCTTGWGFAVLFGVIISVGVGGVAHLNPAVTVAAAITSGDFSNVVPFIAAQMVGAFCGAAVVWLIYLPHWAETESQPAKLGVFCTAPGIRNLPANALTEFLVTIMLVVAGFAIGSKGVGTLPAGFGPYLWGVLVWGIGCSLGGPTGYAINPARDLGPRIAHFVLPIPGKGGSDWGYSWVPVAAPLAGGVVGALICKATGIS